MLDADQVAPLCYNNRVPPNDGYWAQERVYVGRMYTIQNVFIPFRLKVECGQDGTHLPCHGCKHLEVKK